MTDPSSLSGDGHTYERGAITTWLTQKSTSPLTGVVLTAATKALVPNFQAKSLIEAR